MAPPLPIDESQIIRAAEELITEYGDEALNKAKERVNALKSEGFDSIAQIWDRIYEAIKDLQPSKAKTHEYFNAVKKGISLSE